MSVPTRWEKLINDFEMDILKTKCIKSKFLNPELFWKYIENDVNTSKIYILDFFFVFHYLCILKEN